MTAQPKPRESQSAIDSQLGAELEKMKQGGTFKVVRTLQAPMQPHTVMEGKGEVLVLSANNYLGLSNHPDVVKAGHAALDEYGAGTASVRFICGTFSIHHELEAKLAQLHRTPSALTYPSCWQANTGSIPAITGEGDAIIADALNHASLIDGCRMSKAKRAIYKHSDMADLKEKLEAAKGARRILVVTDGVFSMEGDIAPLPDVIELCRTYGATLFMDDCHGVGVMGKHGRGTAEHFGVEGEVDIISGTLGKALGGAAGGYIAASKEVTDYLYQVSRPQIFSNALPATVAASSLEAIRVMEREPQRVERLHKLVDKMREGLKARGFKPLDGEAAIVPLIVGETAAAIRMSEEMLKEGIFITGFGYPVVPEGEARLRIQICADLTDADMERAFAAFEKVGKKLGVI
jgi:glycine C-acetyltransferase